VNQAVAARRLGAEVRFVGSAGTDRHGDQIADLLQAERIPTEGLFHAEDVPTGIVVTMVDPEGVKQAAGSSGANMRLDPASVRRHESLMSWAKVLLCQLEIPIPTVQWVIATGREHGALTILDPAPAQQLPDALLSMVDCLTPNALEAEALTGITVDGPATASVAAQHLLARGVTTVVITLGEQGSLFFDGKIALHFPAFPVRAMDRAGAGDAFNGGLAAGLAADGTWEQVLPLANAAAALTCTKQGGYASLPVRTEVEAFLRSLKR
jgi:ribokinase